MSSISERTKVLFLCTANSCRSQMAEGWARQLRGDQIDAYSAGTRKSEVNQRAARVMAEAGVDISNQRSKELGELRGLTFDYVVTVCSHADANCPVFVGRTKVVHVGFDDPPRLAEGAKTEEEALAHYRRVRDEIRTFVETLPGALTGAAGSPAKGARDAQSHAVRDRVREGYGKIATAGGSCCGNGVSCCGSTPEAAEVLVRHIGYSAEDLADLPDGTNMGLSCGNPTALAALKPGESVLDLGAGGGFDAFIAGRKVGAAGRVIGVDMTPEMLAKARRNAGIYQERTSLSNVEFRLGEIEHLPVADASVDVVISNCVLNLSPDKPQVWREIARVLKPGGRVAVSDLALLKPLPPAVVGMVEALIGCVAGAVLVEETERMAREAGLTGIVLTPKADYVRGMTDWNDPLYRQIVEHLPAGTGAGDYVTSLEVNARKP